MDNTDEPSTRSSAELVVGWDGQPASVAALRYAIGLARRLDAHLHVAHIADFADLPVDPDAWDYEQQLRATLESHAVQARGMLNELDANWTYHPMHGRPPDVLADLAEEVNAVMIVLGAPRGGMHSFIETFAGQSVAYQVTRKHGRAVLLVPDAAPE
ncbi:universal stress protein [Mycobacterium neglectum]|jgi:nucleotide-binding universal stress UspA family protein|uniref:universal stress protein n=1 Tax=Mycobacterium neglectum TaxID=242737 RepID=UPI000BFEC0F7|nr:universal stress protein [Mycobacterium neglectum]